MTTITLEVSDDLAAQISPLRDRLPSLLSQALELLPVGQEKEILPQSTSFTVFDEMIDFLASGPTPKQIIAHKVSPKLQKRLETLLGKNREGGLTMAEAAEMNAFRQVNHVLIRLKARAQRALQSSDQ